MAAYYNEIEPFAAAWLRNLVKAGHIAPGDVDERSVVDVRAEDLRGFTQVHLFAGIGIWSHALRFAGWEDARPVWTASCPCQPFSGAGAMRGTDDERHLWPVVARLVGECRPPAVFGEQVASALAGPWLDIVQDDLEALDYAVGAVAFPAAGVGAPHARDRLWWCGLALENAERVGWRGRADGRGLGAGQRLVGPAEVAGRSDDHRHGELDEARHARPRRPRYARDGIPCDVRWAARDSLLTRDGWRPVEPGSLPVADGYPTRVAELRAYGNAIVAPAAIEWVRAVMECAP